MATGAIIAGYATVDSIGVRQTAQTGAYTAWVLVLYGAFLPAVFLIRRRRLVVDFLALDTWKALGGGLVAMIAYGVVVTAFALGPAGPIHAAYCSPKAPNMPSETAMPTAARFLAMENAIWLTPMDESCAAVHSTSPGGEK